MHLAAVRLRAGSPGACRSLTGRYISVRTDRMSFTEVLRLRSDVTGKGAECVPCSLESSEVFWAVGGKEMAMRHQSGERWNDWDTLKPGEVCKPEELGIQAEELVDLRENGSRLSNRNCRSPHFGGRNPSFNAITLSLLPSYFMS